MFSTDYLMKTCRLIFKDICRCSKSKYRYIYKPKSHRRPNFPSLVVLSELITIQSVIPLCGLFNFGLAPRKPFHLNLDTLFCCPFCIWAWTLHPLGSQRSIHFLALGSSLSCFICVYAKQSKTLRNSVSNKYYWSYCKILKPLYRKFSRLIEIK